MTSSGAAWAAWAEQAEHGCLHMQNNKTFDVRTGDTISTCKMCGNIAVSEHMMSLVEEKERWFTA